MNTPINQLLDIYSKENCNFSDLSWVLYAAHRYVKTMPDSEVRCLLHILATELNNQTKFKKIDWCVSAGRYFLLVENLAVLMDGDPCRDPNLCQEFQSNFWTEEMIKFVASGDYLHE